MCWHPLHVGCTGWAPCSACRCSVNQVSTSHWGIPLIASIPLHFLHFRMTQQKVVTGTECHSHLLPDHTLDRDPASIHMHANTHATHRQTDRQTDTHTRTHTHTHTQIYRHTNTQTHTHTHTQWVLEPHVHTHWTALNTHIEHTPPTLCTACSKHKVAHSN